MISEVDKYKTKLESICRKCANKNYEIPHSCSAYPEKDGIPTRIWNAETKKCDYYTEK